MNDPTERARLKWRCRRGMLELDLLLSGFMERGYDTLNEAEQRHFLELLDYPDQELLEYLMLQRDAPGPEHAQVIIKIRDAV